MLGMFLTDSNPAGVPEVVIRYVGRATGHWELDVGEAVRGPAADPVRARVGDRNLLEYREGLLRPGPVPGPLYTAILRHAVLVMAALAICAVTAALLKDRTDTQAPPPVTSDQAPPAEPGMIPPTILEISRLLAARLLQPHPPGHATHWLNWRRRHQARSRWYHQHAQLARDGGITLVS